MTDRKLVTLEDVLHLAKAAHVDGYIRALRDLKDKRIDPDNVEDTAMASSSPSKVRDQLMQSWCDGRIRPLSFEVGGLAEFIRKVQEG